MHILFCDYCGAARRLLRRKISNNVSKIIPSCLGALCCMNTSATNWLNTLRFFCILTSCCATTARRLFHCIPVSSGENLLYRLVINLVLFLSYCFLSSSSLVTLCSCKTVHHAVHIEPRQLGMIFEMLLLILQWKRRLAALQQSQNRMGTNSAHFQFFCIFTCSITLLSISVKVRNINVDFCVDIKECLLTEYMYLVWFNSA